MCIAIVTFHFCLRYEIQDARRYGVHNVHNISSLIKELLFFLNFNENLCALPCRDCKDSLAHWFSWRAIENDFASAELCQKWNRDGEHQLTLVHLSASASWNIFRISSRLPSQSRSFKEFSEVDWTSENKMAFETTKRYI